MPYRGKPSKGCLACRERKIRCDQRKGGCLNCEKSNRTCPGYRDPLDLMFLDETKKVEKKARRGSQPPSRTSRTTPETKGEGVSDPVLQKTLSADDFSHSLSTDLEGQATAFFFENFTIAQNVDKMSEIYISTSPTDKPGSIALIHSIRALGLAGLSRGANASQLMRMAERQYLTAIRSMNAALFDVEEAKDDKTLLAVMILTIFETLTNYENQDLASWGNHVQGTAALLEARGIDQFRTRDGLRLFVQAAVPICTNSMQLNIPLPDTMFSLMTEALRVDDTDNKALGLLDHKLRFVAFYNKVRSHEIRDLKQIVGKAQQLDDELLGLMAHLTGPWKYDTVPADPEHEMTFLGYCHVFNSFLGAECWNGCWSSRVLLNQMIRSILLIGFISRPPIFTEPSHSALFQKATDNLFHIQNDIIAAAPQYFGHLLKAEVARGRGQEPSFVCPENPLSSMAAMRPYPQGSALPAFEPTDEGKPQQFLWSHFPPAPPLLPTSTSRMDGQKLPTVMPIIRTTGGANLPWVLYLLSTTDIADEKVKTWVEHRLDNVGDNFGVAQSHVLAGRLRTGSIDYAWYRNPWSTTMPQEHGNVSSQTSVAADVSELDLG